MKKATGLLKKLLLLAIPGYGLLIFPNQVLAGATLFTPQSKCTGLDCGGSTITGNYIYEQPFNQAVPFSVQLFSTGNECLRVSVTSQNVDTEMTLVSPDNQVWLNDDFNGTRPQIVAVTTKKG